MAADRGAFIDQSQSFNVFIGEPNFGKLTSMHFYGWKKVSIQVFITSTGFWRLYLSTLQRCYGLVFIVSANYTKQSIVNFFIVVAAFSVTSISVKKYSESN